MNEVWKDILGYENLYQISNLGRVKALPKRGHKSVIMKQSIKKDGYCRILLSKNGKYKTFYVHRLVAVAFIERINDKFEVNHIDGNKSNNNMCNLEWISRSDNIKHAIKNGLFSTPNHGKFGGDHPTSKKIFQYDLCGNLIKIWNSASEAERFGGFRASNIYACVAKRRKTFKGFIWKHT